MLINSAATFIIQLLKTPLTPTQNTAAATAATTFAISPAWNTTAALLLPTIILTTTIVFVDNVHAQSVPVND